MPKVFQNKPISEITIRRFERPFNETKEELLKKFCISIGLLQPGDSRDVVSDIFALMLEKSRERQMLSANDIEKEIKAKRVNGSAGSNIRRQLLRMQKMGLIEKSNNQYRLKEFYPLEKLIEEYLINFQIKPTLERIKDYAKAIDNMPKKEN